MSSRSSGYSNAAYCNMYDVDDAEDGESFSLSHCTSETFVDDPEPECERGRPLGASGPFRLQESRLSKSQPSRRRQRSFSAPRNQSTVNVLAPMIAQARFQEAASPGIRRSRSAVFCKDAEDRRISVGERDELLGLRGHSARRTFSVNQGCRMTPARVQDSVSVYDLDSSLTFCQRPRQFQYLSPGKSAANLAVIPPNTRPLLAPSPVASDLKKGSWAALPSRAPTNTLSLSGMFLLFTSTFNCLLCFYLLAKKGRHYYIDFAVISNFAMLVLGFVGVRMGRYEWALNRNYLAGYMVLSMLDVLLCGVLGLIASDWRPPDLPEVLEVASGGVCGLSALMLLLALCLGASSCCRSPPPDNRVAHSVPSFIV